VLVSARSRSNIRVVWDLDEASIQRRAIYRIQAAAIWKYVCVHADHELGLETTRRRASAPNRAAKASEMAAQEIDHIHKKSR
jgi:hypothetical protein